MKFLNRVSAGCLISLLAVECSGQQAATQSETVARSQIVSTTKSHLDNAHELIRRQLYELAIKHYDLYLINNPAESLKTKAKVISERANIYFKIGQLRRAIGDYSLAIDLAKTEGGFYLARGKVHLVNEDFESAVADFDQAIFLKVPPDTLLRVEAYLGRGLVWEDAGEDRHALADYRRALHLNSSSSAANNALASLIASSSEITIDDIPVGERTEGKLKFAEKLARQATKSADKKSAYFATLADIQYQRNQLGDAVESLDQALKLAEHDDHQELHTKRDDYQAEIDGLKKDIEAKTKAAQKIVETANETVKAIGKAKDSAKIAATAMTDALATIQEVEKAAAEAIKKPDPLTASGITIAALKAKDAFNLALQAEKTAKDDADAAAKAADTAAKAVAAVKVAVEK